MCEVDRGNVSVGESKGTSGYRLVSHDHEMSEMGASMETSILTQDRLRYHCTSTSLPTYQTYIIHYRIPPSTYWWFGSRLSRYLDEPAADDDEVKLANEFSVEFLTAGSPGHSPIAPFHVLTLLCSNDKVFGNVMVSFIRQV